MKRSIKALTESVHRYADDVTTFLLVVGHDLQSPLQSIQGSSELLTVSEVEQVDLQEVLRRIGRSSKLMGH